MNYYSDNLSAERLEKCYEIAPPRIRQYLKAEIDYIRSVIPPTSRVLELGCGYGRIFKDLAHHCELLAGIDISIENLKLAKSRLSRYQNIFFCEMNAVELGFKDNSFDVVLCIQNGLSAFHENPLTLMQEAIRVTRPGGFALFSGYSDKFWDARLEWFIRQSEHGLLGEIDHNATGNGEIVCKDGFRATTFRPDDFTRLAVQLGVTPTITEVDDSCLFCRIDVPNNFE
ncbi:MAG: class I SAM-dependent methyltransferase [Candidatus Marinimicrobia bacterium]|nr:class I SAM-dependent methyltransferase [Candidatus Neomarinimicrobiota bacterium]